MAGRTRKRHRPEENIAKLRSIEPALAQGNDLEAALRDATDSPPTYYRSEVAVWPHGP